MDFVQAQPKVSSYTLEGSRQKERVAARAKAAVLHYGGWQRAQGTQLQTGKKDEFSFFLEAAILKLVLEVPQTSTLPSRDTLGHRDLGTFGTQRPRLSCPQSLPSETRA